MVPTNSRKIKPVCRADLTDSIAGKGSTQISVTGLIGPTQQVLPADHQFCLIILETSQKRVAMGKFIAFAAYNVLKPSIFPNQFFRNDARFVRMTHGLIL